MKTGRLAAAISIALSGGVLPIHIATASQNVEDIQSNETMQDIILEAGDAQNVYGNAYNTEIIGGLQIIHSGGSSQGIVINAVNGRDRNEYLRIDGGAVSDLTVHTGTINSDRGTLTDTTINGGRVILSNSTVNNLEVNQGVIDTPMIDVTGGEITGTLDVNGGNILLSNTVVNADVSVTGMGEVVLSNGTELNNASVNGGLIYNASGVTNDSIMSGGGEVIYGNGVSNNAIIYSGWQSIGNYFNGGVANGTLLYGGSQTVSEDGVANDTIIHAGVQYVYDGGEVNNTTIHGGQSWLFTGAIASGTTTVNSSAELLMDAGSRATDVEVNGGTISIADLTNDGSTRAPAQIDALTMNGGNISFLRDVEGHFSTLNITELNGNGNFLFNTSLAERNSNFVTIENGTGNFGISVVDSGKEIANHAGLTVNLIHDQGGDIYFEMVTANGRSTRAVDGGTYMYTLRSEQDKDGHVGGNVWYLGNDYVDDSVDDGNGGGDNGNLKTTPATDAVLSLATAGLNIVRGELDALRAYRNNQTTERKHGEGNVWGHYLGKKSAVDTSNGAAYKLHQNGFELGGDITTGFDKGHLVTGGFVTLSDNKVNHARGGKSKVDSYGLGAYATWYDNSGFYVDGAVKANRLESNLNARMTNGNSTSGNWHQYGITTAVETGFTFKPSETLFVEPFVRTTGTHINNANVTLSNGMKAETGKARSLTAEAGTRVGSQFTVGKTQFAPYLHLSVEQEFAKSNQTTINGVNRFDNNLNGTSGKYGAGMSAQLANNVALYGEVNYRQGSHIEEPIQGTMGIRVGF